MDNEKEGLGLEQLAKNGPLMQQVLEEGKLLVLRTKDEFLYFLDDGVSYRMFRHTAGQFRADRKVQRKSPQDGEMFEGAAKAVDLVFSVEFDPSMDIPDVLYNTEEAILEAYPMVGEEQKIDFTSPDPLGMGMEDSEDPGESEDSQNT